MTATRKYLFAISHIFRDVPKIAILVGMLAVAAEFPSAAMGQGTFVSTGSLNVSRGYATATLLNNGKVLVTGGYSGDNGPGLQSAELYDPATGVFTLTGNMTTARTGHTATLLGNGKVLIAGGTGNSQSGIGPGGQARIWIAGTAAELYDPATGTFSATGVTIDARDFGTATLLSDGTVLLAAGQFCSGSACPTPTAELYDSSTGTFTATGDMASYNGLNGWTAALVNNGKVFFVGGYYGLGPTPAQIYDPGAGTFTALTDNFVRSYPTATNLKSGVILIAGGDAIGPTPGPTGELFNPVTNTFTVTGQPTTQRTQHTATLLGNGTVLLAGGTATDSSSSTALGSAELYDPGTGVFTATGSLIRPRADMTATLLQDGTVLIAGGTTSAGGGDSFPPTLSSAELYKPVSGGGSSGTTVTVSPQNLTFSAEASGTMSSPQSVTLANTGTTAVAISGISRTGVNAADFAQSNNCGASLAAVSSCQINVTFTPSGVGPRTATLSVANGATGTPLTVALTGSGPDFTVSASATNAATVTAGQPATYTLLVGSVAGFAQTVTLSCSGAPVGATCTLSPSTVAVGPGSPSTVTGTVTTTARSSGWPIILGDRPIPLMLLLINAGAFLLVMLLLRRRIAQRQTGFRWAYVAALGLLACGAITLTSCGGGAANGSSSSSGSSGSGGTGAVSGTQAGTYTITVTGNFTSGATNLSHATKLTLVVQ